MSILYVNPSGGRRKRAKGTKKSRKRGRKTKGIRRGGKMIYGAAAAAIRKSRSKKKRKKSVGGKRRRARSTKRRTGGKRRARRTSRAARRTGRARRKARTTNVTVRVAVRNPARKRKGGGRRRRNPSRRWRRNPDFTGMTHEQMMSSLAAHRQAPSTPISFGGGGGYRRAVAGGAYRLSQAAQNKQQRGIMLERVNKMRAGMGLRPMRWPKGGMRNRDAFGRKIGSVRGLSSSRSSYSSSSSSSSSSRAARTRRAAARRRKPQRGGRRLYARRRGGGASRRLSPRRRISVPTVRRAGHTIRRARRGYGGKPAQRVARRLVLNPGLAGGMMMTVKAALPVALSLYMSRVLANKIAAHVPASISTKLGKGAAPAVAAVTCLGAHFATMSGPFAPYRAGIMLGTGINLVDTLVSAFAPANVSTMFGLAPAPAVVAEATAGYLPGADELSDYASDDGLGSYEMAGELSGLDDYTGSEALYSGVFARQ